MSTIGQREKVTQQRVVKLFTKTLGYEYLGNWIDRADNSNVEPALLRAFLKRQGYDDTLIGRALHVLTTTAGDTSKSLYDRNKAVYDLLRYGVKVAADVGEKKVTVWLIDWAKPEKNDFAVAEEVAVVCANAHGKRPDVVLYVNEIGRAHV